MFKRKLIIGKYDTDFDGLWTLSGLGLTDPDYQAKFVDVPGRNGPLDMSTALTDGEPCYGSRTLTATLESSEGTRDDRNDRIGEMMNALDGRRLEIIHPDFPNHYLSGRVQIKQNYSDPAHAAVTVTAICDPWLYSRAVRSYSLTATTTKQTIALANNGRRTVVPEIVVTGSGASILFDYGTGSTALGEGSWLLPGLALKTGGRVLTYSGSGSAKITYREAVLR